MQEIPFCTRVCRYFFFSWLFRDIGEGSLFERAANLRYNREQARWLPVYMRRWVAWGAVFCSLAAAADMLLGADAVSRLLYAIAGLSISFNVAIAAAWVGLRGLYGPVS